jgi:hypothetical protein
VDEKERNIIHVSLENLKDFESFDNSTILLDYETYCNQKSIFMFTILSLIEENFSKNLLDEKLSHSFVDFIQKSKEIQFFNTNDLKCIPLEIRLESFNF